MIFYVYKYNCKLQIINFKAFMAIMCVYDPNEFLGIKDFTKDSTTRKYIYVMKSLYFYMWICIFTQRIARGIIRGFVVILLLWKFSDWERVEDGWRLHGLWMEIKLKSKVPLFLTLESSHLKVSRISYTIFRVICSMYRGTTLGVWLSVQLKN